MKLPLILICLIAISCSTSSLHHPFAQKELDETPKRWTELYQSANELLSSNKGESCTKFSKLSAEDKFPLLPLVRIKRVESCQNADLAKELWKNNGSDIPRWAKEYYTRQSLKIALELGIKDQAAYFSSELSDYQAPKAEKIALMKQAFEWASEDKKTDYAKRLLKLSPQLILNYSPLLNQEQIKAKKKNKKYIPDEMLFELAQDLEKDRRFTESRKYYKQIIDSKSLASNTKHEAWKRSCLTFKLEREREKYVKCFSDHITQAPTLELTDDSTVDLKISYARALWTIDQTDASKKQLLDLLKQDAISKTQRARIHLALAGIEQEMKAYETAATQLQLALTAISSEKSEMKENIFWRLGFINYLQQNYESALNFWKQLAQNSENHGLKVQAQFWTGKALQKLERIEEAKELFGVIAEVDSFGYYGILAHRELGREFSSLAPLARNDVYPQEMPDTLEWLLYLKENDTARRYLRFYSYQIKSEEDVQRALPIFHYAKAYDLSILMFYKIPAEKRNAQLEDLIRYVFPLPYNREVLETATRFSVPPEYIFSIIRQESAFNTYARSFADAFGLMQVIPEKATLLGKSLDVPYRQLDDLYLPEVNLPIGTAILADNIGRYKRSFVASTAAYNAGDTPVARWYQDRYRGDLLEFIENIPYEETQTYVKLVMRNMINYYRLTTPTNFKFRDEFFNQL